MSVIKRQVTGMLVVSADPAAILGFRLRLCHARVTPAYVSHVNVGLEVMRVRRAAGLAFRRARKTASRRQEGGCGLGSQSELLRTRCRTVVNRPAYGGRRDDAAVRRGGGHVPEFLRTALPTWCRRRANSSVDGRHRARIRSYTASAAIGAAGLYRVR